MSDLISRQMALEMLNDNELERQVDDLCDGDLHRYKRAAQRIIAQLPTIEPKKGKWIWKDRLVNRVYPVIGMNEAGEEVKVYVHEVRNEKRNYCSRCFKLGDDTFLKYCPNCGARMGDDWEEPEINPCRGCDDYDGRGGCKSQGGCGAERGEE